MYFYSCINTIKTKDKNICKMYSAVFQNDKACKGYGQSKNIHNRVVVIQ
jgi:hypothetical protein